MIGQGPCVWAQSCRLDRVCHSLAHLRFTPSRSKAKPKFFFEMDPWRFDGLRTDRKCFAAFSKSDHHPNLSDLEQSQLVSSPSFIEKHPTFLYVAVGYTLPFTVTFGHSNPYLSRTLSGKMTRYEEYTWRRWRVRLLSHIVMLCTELWLAFLPYMMNNAQI